MSTSNLAAKPRLANHLAAPITAGFVGSMRQAFGNVEVTYVNEGDVHLGSPAVVTDSDLVAYSRSKTVKGNTVYSSLSYTVARAA